MPDFQSMNGWRVVRDTSGMIAVKFAIMLPVILGLSAYSYDFAHRMSEATRLQQAVDAAALAAAKKLPLTDGEAEDLDTVARTTVAAFLAANGRISTIPVTTEVAVREDNMTVEVRAAAPFESISATFTNSPLPNLAATAVARVVGTPNICILGLNQSENGTISLEQNARVTGNNCSVFSNSTHKNGLKSKNSATLEATTICTRGGREGGPGNFSPDPNINCPGFEDPLESRLEPVASDCDPSLPKVVSDSRALLPGTYCGLEIAAGGDVLLRRGIYVFKDLPLIVRNGGRLVAENAGLYFTGAKANFTFESQSSISLTAPVDGPMAGIVLFGSRSQPDDLVYSILSNDARKLVGLIYIPKGELRVDATSPIADKSEFTAIVADKMRLYGGPHLVLNTNYNETDVPVPEGIAGAGQPPVLIK